MIVVVVMSYIGVSGTMIIGGKNPASKYIIIEGITYNCWSQAEEKLNMSKYKIKKTYKVEIKDKK